MRRIVSLAVVALLAVTSLFAADLGRYKGWDDSPQGYFMTKAERQQWAQLETEAEAETFVADFLAKRDDGFAAEVAKRVEMADKYLGFGKMPGSQTIRGKLVIVLGPPTAMDVSNQAKKSVGKRDNPVMAGAMSNIGMSGTDVKGDATASAFGSSTSTENMVRVYTISFKDNVFAVEADGASGKDRFLSKTDAGKAEKAFEAAAEASIKK